MAEYSPSQPARSAPGNLRSQSDDADDFEDLRLLPEQLADAAIELRRQRDSGEIDAEDYEDRLQQMQEAAQDLTRTQELEKEQPPGEVELDTPEAPWRPEFAAASRDQ